MRHAETSSEMKRELNKHLFLEQYTDKKVPQSMSTDREVSQSTVKRSISHARAPCLHGSQWNMMHHLSRTAVVGVHWGRVSGGGHWAVRLLPEGTPMWTGVRVVCIQGW